MNNKFVLSLMTILTLGLINTAYPSDSEHHLEHEETTKITEDLANKNGINTGITGPQKLHKSIISYGRLTTAPEKTSHVRARFAGIIKSVSVTIGDQVSTGELLAIVESNESLKQYKVIAPITGTIIQRHANAGEMTQNQVLFSIADFQSLWAELRIFPQQQALIEPGQPIKLLNNGETPGNTKESIIEHVLPGPENTAYTIARAKIPNDDSKLLPGLMIGAKIDIAEFTTALAVKNTALQTMDSQLGIFTKAEDTYTFKPVTIGRSDNQFSEVISGVAAGVEYVTENSYLIKADIEKSEAEHEH
ncbi:HlyD family efflux transporter periplasmic adaptor subunit [Ketobacter sp. MCCC 1A13808]|uniref:efflux RND transporter periplasmic adaptor subunit n=1 Tax=Ketobacter sp. MCCC 1A13808 TaxID=2602738 RepID=UPI0012EB6FC4|nr:efflux RND transporter periplasmic adaptor subunit [Ketobacter sp. MCCC 1A13808]MVF14723.1 HlyD family efflux transporter periplasmic adaptor subunit [Ketobacter sp. MCCC 1A13808]